METSSFPLQLAGLPGANIRDFLTNSAEREWSGPFTFIQGADTQFGMIDSYILKKDSVTWDKEIALTEAAIRLINKLQPRPKFFVVCGDLLDAFPFAEGGQLEVRQKQYLDFVEVFKQLDPEIKLVCVCGNHDIGNNPTPDTLKNYRREFGPDFFSFWCGGVKFVVLNSQYFKSPELVPDEAKAHDEFMNTIADSSAKHIVVFQHIPFFVKSFDEEDDFFTVDGNSRLKFLDRLYDFGVRYVFCGHYHRHGGGFYKDMSQVVTSAISGQLGDDASGFRVVRVEESELSHHYVNLPIQFSGELCITAPEATPNLV